MTSIVEYKLPRVLEKFGKNWDGFREQADYEFKQLQYFAYYLYRINDVSTMDQNILDYEIAANDINASVDNINAKKSARRNHVSIFKRKGDPEVYLDICEAIVGIRGLIYSGLDVASFVFDQSTWASDAGSEAQSISWPGDFPQLEAWINVKTSDTSKINSILDILRKKVFKPLFMKVIITNDTFAILGVV